MAVTNFSLKEKTNTVGNNTTLLSINLLYYINANEIPSELSGKNMISSRETNMLSSHVKRSPLLWQKKGVELKWFCISLVFI